MAALMKDCVKCVAHPVCESYPSSESCLLVRQLVEEKFTPTNAGSPKLPSVDRVTGHVFEYCLRTGASNADCETVVGIVLDYIRQLRAAKRRF